MNFDLIIGLIKRNPFMLLYGLSLIIAVIQYHKYYDSPLKYFPIFLLYTFINEILGGIIHLNSEFSIHFNEFYIDNNWLIFNIYNVAVHLYLFYIFSSFINDLKYKKVILYGTLIYVFASLINPFLENFMLHPQTYAYLIGGVTIIISVILYFKNHKTESQLIFDNRDILSWMGVGLLIFYFRL